MNSPPRCASIGSEIEGSFIMWNAIVCTCQNRESATSFRKELLVRQRKGLLERDALILAVDDPRPSLGSGSATLNALLCVSELLASQEGHKVVTGDALYNARILILLLGSTFPFSPCGHAFMPDPAALQPGADGSGFDQTEVQTNVDQLMATLRKLCANTPPGVWVTSTDMLLQSSEQIEPLDLTGFESTVVALTVRALPQHAMLHGACRITDSGEFAQIIHMGGKDAIQTCIRPDGMCDMLSGIVYLSPQVAEILLSLHTLPPLDACTYIGLDNGAQPLSMSLFFDILLCLTTDITRDDYVLGAFKAPPTISAHQPLLPTSGNQRDALIRGRAVLWKVLKGLKMKAIHLEGFEHHYLRLIASDVLTRYSNIAENGGGACVINCLLPKSALSTGSVLINCRLTSPIAVGANCFLSGLGSSFQEYQTASFVASPLSIPPGLALQEVSVGLGRGRLHSRQSVVVIYGVEDNLVAIRGAPGGTFCNQEWSQLFERTGIQSTDLWLPNTPETLLNARLYVACHADAEVGLRETFWLFGNGQDSEILHRWRSAWRVSLTDILRCVDCDAEFAKTREIVFESQKGRMMAALRENEPVCLLPFLKSSLIEGKETLILETLDRVAEGMTNQLIICRIYACIADMLGYMAGSGGGIRGGPAGNLSWKGAFNLLEQGEFSAATKALAAERANWIDDGPDRIIRASRHYERAGQILTRKAVATARAYINGSYCTPPDIGQQITVTAPARIDMSGGWTDTPPQAYEWGGVVVTLALKINNEYPIKAVAERIAEPMLVLVQCAGDGSVVEELEVTQLLHLADYSQPHAPGALLKAAFVCAGIVEYPSQTSLKEQLLTRYKCGFKLRSSSNLPQGSGLGTSSILGGAILAALWRAAGNMHDCDSLIHAVLHMEQLLTTGGGWQDQCGGLYGGAKISQSGKKLPVKITTQQIKTPPGFLDTVSSHLLLVYTGKTRLARNLLQDVLRNWHSREAQIVQNMEDLVENAYSAQSAFENGNLAELGACLSRYQLQKVVMAPGSMPKVVTLFVEKISKFIHGCTLAGAGGGGFLMALLKEPGCLSQVKSIMETQPELKDFVVYESAVDDTGIQYQL